MGKDVNEILAERFILTLEQAKDLHILYRLCGSADEGIEAASQAPEASGISKEVIRQVFYSLDDLYQLEKEYREMWKWWKTGEM